MVGWVGKAAHPQLVSGAWSRGDPPGPQPPPSELRHLSGFFSLGARDVLEPKVLDPSLERAVLC